MLHNGSQEIVVLEWKEIVDEGEEHQANQNHECINAMRNCGFVKFFRTIGLRAEMELLPYLISLWDVDLEIFIIKSQEQEIEEMDVYVIMDFPNEGKRSNSLDLTKNVKVQGL